MALSRALAAAAVRKDEWAVMPGIFTAYEPVFRRAIHIVMTVTGLLLIAGLWEDSTLLPILRATSLVTIVLMAGMSILAALGVAILPLLAGHGAPYEQRVGRAPYGVRQDHPRVPRRGSQVRAPCGDR